MPLITSQTMVDKALLWLAFLLLTGSSSLTTLPCIEKSTGILHILYSANDIHLLTLPLHTVAFHIHSCISTRQLVNTYTHLLEDLHVCTYTPTQERESCKACLCCHSAPHCISPLTRMFNPVTIVQQTRAMPGSSGEPVRKASSVVFRVAGGPLLPGVKPLVYTELVKMTLLI